MDLAYALVSLLFSGKQIQGLPTIEVVKEGSWIGATGADTVHAPDVATPARLQYAADAAFSAIAANPN
jgi:hypothetical protein